MSAFAGTFNVRVPCVLLYIDDAGRRRYHSEIVASYASHLLRLGAADVVFSPDAQHLRKFNIRGWLERYGFRLESPEGGTGHGGLFRNGTMIILVHFRPGQADVSGNVEGRPLVGECKGGVIKSRHAGVVSKLRMGLFAAVGQALYLDAIEGGRHVLVMPCTHVFESVARKLAARLATVGVEIDMVEANGRIIRMGVLATSAA